MWLWPQNRKALKSYLIRIVQRVASHQSWCFVLFSFRSSGYQLCCTVGAVYICPPACRACQICSTACGHRIANRKWKETKLQPGTAGPGNMLGCCSVSFHFLWAILCPQGCTKYHDRRDVTHCNSPLSYSGQGGAPYKEPIQSGHQTPAQSDRHSRKRERRHVLCRRVVSVRGVTNSWLRQNRISEYGEYGQKWAIFVFSKCKTAFFEHQIRFSE